MRDARCCTLQHLLERSRCHVLAVISFQQIHVPGQGRNRTRQNSGPYDCCERRRGNKPHGFYLYTAEGHNMLNKRNWSDCISVDKSYSSLIGYHRYLIKQKFPSPVKGQAQPGHCAKSIAKKAQGASVSCLVSRTAPSLKDLDRLVHRISDENGSREHHLRL